MPEIAFNGQLQIEIDSERACIGKRVQKCFAVNSSHAHGYNQISRVQ